MSEQTTTYEVTLKRIEPVRVAAVKHGEPITMPEIPGVMEELFGLLMPHLQQHQAQIVGVPLALYDGDDKTMTVEVAIPVSGDLPESDAVRVYSLPAIENAACITLKGSYDGLSAAHDWLYGWTMQQGYTIIGAAREVYLVDRMTTQNPDDYLTELQYPVQKV